MPDTTLTSSPGPTANGETPDEDTIVVAASGNGMKPHDRYDTFLEISGGDGNRDEGPEVHLRIRSNDGHNDGQSWFAAADLLAAIQRATNGPRAEEAPSKAAKSRTVTGAPSKTGGMGGDWVPYDTPKPLPVPDPDIYWTEPPPEQSARCAWWVRQIERGWMPNRRIRAEGYYRAAGWYGVYIWEYRHVITPAVDAQAAARSAAQPTATDSISASTTEDLA